MKKYLWPAVMIMLSFSVTGCAGSTPVEETQSQAPLPEENNLPLLAEGETVTIDGVCEFHVDYVAISKHPELYYEAETGKTCVDFCITYKHLADYVAGANTIIDGKLIYSGQYEYSGTDMVAEEDGESLSPAHWAELNSLDTRQIHYFFTVPEMVQTDDRMVELNMRICENDYRVIVREGETGTLSDSVSGGASKDVAEGEVVTTENARFYVEYSEFTKEVTPPVTGSGYNYYAAEDGKVYIDFCIAYTNMSTGNIAANKAVIATLDQAEAQTTVTEQSERSLFDYSNLVDVIPLCTEYIHWIFQVPEELETDNEPVTISFKIDGSRYTYSLK